MIMYSLVFLLLAVVIIGIGLGLTLWLIKSSKKTESEAKATQSCNLGPGPKLQDSGGIEADFTEVAVSESDMNILESKVNELGAAFLSENVYQGKVISFYGINLKIKRLEPANANKVTAKTEISIVPSDKRISAPAKETLPGTKTQPNSQTSAPKKNILMILTSIISFILVLISIFYIVSGFLKSDFVKQVGLFFGQKKHQVQSHTKKDNAPANENKALSPAPRLSDKYLAELMYPGKVVSNFTISGASQENVMQYIGYPGFYIKTKPFSDFATGSERSLNTIVIAAKEYFDLTGDGVEELIVVSIGDGEILPDCMANLSANNVIIYKWNGSNYEELWRANMDLGQEGKFEKLEIANEGNIPVIRLYGTRFTHGNGAPFIDSYKWNGVIFAPASN